MFGFGKKPKRYGEGEEFQYASTYEELNEAPSWSHYGVGHKDKIPTLVPSVIANVFYLIFIFGIAFGFTKLLLKWTPWVVATGVSAVAAFSYYIKMKWENITVHRLGIWWNPDKVILGDYLCDQDKTETQDFEAGTVAQMAKRYSDEAYIAAARAQTIRERGRTHMAETFPDLEAKRREHIEHYEQMGLGTGLATGLGIRPGPEGEGQTEGQTEGQDTGEGG